MQIDHDKMNAFMGKMLADLGAALNAPLIRLGDNLGLYKAMAANGPVSPAELAQRTGTTERYIREWLSAQAASGYVEYDSATERFTLPPEQAAVFADEDSPVFLAGVGDLIAAMADVGPKVGEAFRTGQGVGWESQNPCLFCGTARFFRTTYKHHLVQEWLPALDGVDAKLARGGSIADIGCGHGVSTILMAQAHPNARCFGYDYHRPSITAARRSIAGTELAKRITFETSSAKDVPAGDYDLVCFFDCLHDMGDPVGALRHVRTTMKPDGTCMIVEPFANDRLEDNLNPVGRLYYAASTLICTPASLSQEVGLALGAQAGEARMRQVAEEAGFVRFRRVAETPFNLIYEARA
jgi:2-polyprenyl-3-methyl-5-hydroxy-6-metoxy-1,4-benzoquinol methylase